MLTLAEFRDGGGSDIGQSDAAVQLALDAAEAAIEAALPTPTQYGIGPYISLSRPAATIDSVVIDGAYRLRTPVPLSQVELAPDGQLLDVGVAEHVRVDYTPVPIPAGLYKQTQSDLAVFFLGYNGQASIDLPGFKGTYSFKHKKRILDNFLASALNKG